VANTIDVQVPDIGDFKDVEVIEVHVAAGDRVSAEDPLITLETDKASMDVPAPEAGEVISIAVSAGSRVSEGTVILALRPETGVDAAAAPAESPTDGGPAAAGGPAPAPDGEPPTAGQTQAAGTLDVQVPDIGDFQGVEVIEVHVAAGDSVAMDDPLITLETDKASMDVPAPAAGMVKSVAVSVGARVSEGDPVVVLSTDATGAGAESAGAATIEPGPPASESAPRRPTPETLPEVPPAPAVAPAGVPPSVGAGRLPPVDESGFSQAHAGPSVRRLARELGADLGRMTGSGAKGRITQEDVKAYVKRALAAASAAEPTAAGSGLPELPAVDFAKFGAFDLQPLSRVQKISGPRLHASWVNIPHVTQFDEADITEMEAARQELKKDAEREGVRLTPLAFVVMACAKALRALPGFNTSLHPDGQHLVVKKYIHLGFAADTPNGLVVPVIRDVDTKRLFEIARELGELSERARDGKLAAADMQGGCFTISSLGSIGGTAFTPIINPPEVAILGVSRSAIAPVWDGEAFAPRLMLPLSLSYDHRVIDGAAAVRFTRYLADLLGDVERLLA
jgi:pyruvate dehydrogenase E2 component (dihydrolipoamide acetyltransferase)